MDGWLERLRTVHIGRRGFLRVAARYLAAGGAMAATGPFIIGCRPGAPATPAAVETARVPKPGGTLYAAAEVDPVSLDPHTNANFSSLQAYDHIYESLVAYDENMNIIPALAERWEVSQDSSVYTFYLREGVKFHDGGQLTAEDVKYSLERVLNPKTSAPWRDWLGPVKEIKVVSKSVVQVVLEEPFPALLGGLAGNRASGIIPKESAERKNLNIEAVGTGPFRLVQYVPQDHITYERFAEYWDKPLPYFDRMIFKVLTEENARLAALQAGQIQYAVLSPQGAEQIKNNPKIRILKSPYAWVDLTYINVSRSPMDNPKVRKALRMAVDTTEMIQKAMLGYAVPSGPIPTGYGEWALDPGTLPYLKADIEGAKRLLAEAGFPEGRGLKVTISCSPQYPDFVANATIMKEAFAKIGVEAELEVLEWGTFVQRTRTGNYQLANSANTFRPDPDGYIYPYFHSKGSLNASYAGGYRNPSLEPLMERARTIADRTERVRVYHEIQKILLEELPNYWWYVKQNIEAVSTRLEGYSQSFTGRRLFLKKAWLTG